MKKNHLLLLIFLLLQHLFVVAQEKYVPTKEDIEWATQFAPISGPGKEVVGDGHGGWRSGSEGVKYSGPNSRPEYDLDWGRASTGSVIEKGLVPPFKPALELHVRDAVVTLGGDGYYYMTGSTGDNIWAFTVGVELWKSSDLKEWEYMGLIWDIDKEAEQWVKNWRRHPKRAVRAVWAPEIHYIKNNYFIVFSMCPNGMGILKSSTGKPEGPYINAFDKEGPVTNGGIDPTLFEDEDGKVYFTYGGATRIALMKDDMSGFDGPFRNLRFDDPDHNPRHHAAKCEPRGMNDLGHEGAVLFKRNGIYYLGAADDYEGRYSTCLAMSKNIYGPYRKRHESIPCGGGTGFFKDKEGNWWCSYFGNDSQSHFREKVGFVKTDFTSEGFAFPAKDQPFVDAKNKEEWEKKWNEVWRNKYK